MDAKRKRAAFLPRLVQAVVLALGLAQVMGCASIRGTLRDAHGALGEVADLSEFDASASQEQRLYYVEDLILDSCQPLLAGARLAFDGEDVPLLTGLFMRLGALFNSGHCARTVAAARVEIADVRLHLAQP